MPPHPWQALHPLEPAPPQRTPQKTKSAPPATTCITASVNSATNSITPSQPDHQLNPARATRQSQNLRDLDHPRPDRPGASTRSRPAEDQPALLARRNSPKSAARVMLRAERRVGTGHRMRLPVPGNAYAAMASAIASATRTALSLSRGSTRTTPPAGTEVAATAALSLARERFAEKQASGSRPCPVARRSHYRPEPGVRGPGGRYWFAFAAARAGLSQRRPNVISRRRGANRWRASGQVPHPPSPRLRPRECDRAAARDGATAMPRRES